MDMNTDSTNNSQVPPISSSEYRKLHIRPWTRFFARFIDITIFSMILTISLALFYPDLLNQNKAISLIVFFSWFLVETVLMATFGTTLGKYLFNIKVRDLNGNKLKFHSAFKRSFWVWFAGCGAGTPIVYLGTFIFSYFQLKNTGTTFWDKKTFVVTHGDRGHIKSSIAFLIIIGVITLKIWRLYDEYQTLTNKSSNNNYAEEIEKENKALPKMVDDETEFSKVNFLNNTLITQYRLVNKDVNDINTTAFYQEMRDALLTKACSKTDPHPFLAEGHDIAFEYYDKNKSPITTIVIKPSDCE